MFEFATASMDDVTAIVGLLPRQNHSVKLTKQFKGLELNQDVRFVEVNRDWAAVKASNPGMLPILEGDIHLHSRAFPKPVAARIQKVDLEKGMFLLSDLAYMDWKERRADRVQPGRPTHITLRCKGKSYRVFLEDISAHGMGILANRGFIKEKAVRLGAWVYLDFSLGQNFDCSDLKGKILYVHRDGDSLTKAGIQLFPTLVQTRSLLRYIARRRKEILDEIAEAVSGRDEPRGVQSLYF